MKLLSDAPRVDEQFINNLKTNANVMHQDRRATIDAMQSSVETTAAETQTELLKECAGCKTILGAHSFSKNQWKKVSLSRRCKSCTSSFVVKKEAEEKKIAKKRSLNDKFFTTMEKKQKIAPDADGLKIISLGEEFLSYENKQTVAMQEEEKTHIMKKRPLSIPFSGRKSFQFEWASFPITKSDERSVGNIIVQRGEFGPIDEHRRIETSGILAACSQMNSSQALSLRNQLLQQKAMFNHVRLQSQAKHIHSRYRGGESVVALANSFDSPPLQCF